MKKRYIQCFCLPLACVFALTACAPADADAEPLPIEVPDEDERPVTALDDMFLDLAEEDPALAVRVWAWIIKEFGPYPTGSVTETTESVTLEPNRIYYLEITDKWGDGIYSPAGYVVVRSSDNSLVDQIYAIDGFGIRSVFRTGKEAVGIEGVSSQSAADADIVVYSTDGTVAYKGKRSAMDVTPGVYIIYDSASRTVSKVTINK